MRLLQKKNVLVLAFAVWGISIAQGRDLPIIEDLKHAVLGEEEPSKLLCTQPSLEPESVPTLPRSPIEFEIVSHEIEAPPKNPFKLGDLTEPGHPSGPGSPKPGQPVIGGTPHTPAKPADPVKPADPSDTSDDIAEPCARGLTLTGRCAALNSELTYEQYSTKGKTRMQALDAKLQSIKQDQTKTLLQDKPLDPNAHEVLSSNPSYEFEDIQPNVNINDPKMFQNVLEVFSALRLDITKLFKRSKIDASGEVPENIGEKVQENILDNYFSTPGDDEVIICNKNDLEGANVAPGKDKIQNWTPLFYQQINKVYVGTVPDIKYVIREAVINSATQKTILRAHSDMPGNVVNGKGTWDPRSPNPEEQNAATALIETPNGNGV
ncbi:hypothetical protein G7Y89_g5405 [Cudoniella acicularis]|uniref:Uncharacterized protein n=1 Tax=Cudoniella acicularis TaxID=354080 RepID=A0A8H4RP26_9HELO|nr:hypothetical protein G7Y89_g5405 [Cudoniella acicularis]